MNQRRDLTVEGRLLDLQVGKAMSGGASQLDLVHALLEVMDTVMAAVGQEYEGVLPTLGLVEHELGIAPHVILGPAADDTVVASGGRTRHRDRVSIGEAGISLVAGVHRDDVLAALGMT